MLRSCIVLVTARTLSMFIEIDPLLAVSVIASAETYCPNECLATSFRSFGAGLCSIFMPDSRKLSFDVAFAFC